MTALAERIICTHADELLSSHTLTDKTSDKSADMDTFDAEGISYMS